MSSLNPDSSHRPSLPGETPQSLNCRGTFLDLQRAAVMGILNVTPDSFSDGGKFDKPDAALRQAERMLEEGARIIDIGGYSSRPGANNLSPEVELARLEPVVKALRREFPDALLSLDTFRATVARPMLELGVHILNDISGGTLDPGMPALAAEFQAPYVVMHMPGTPQTMQQHARYGEKGVVTTVQQALVERVNVARAAGVLDVIVDPGFGFGKTPRHNFELLRQLEVFSLLGCPLLVGISRKSMLYKPFNTTPDDVVELSSALHFKCLEKGAKILRVHDVQAAARVVRLFEMMEAAAG